MTDSTELLVLRLALIGVLFLFLLIVAGSLRRGLHAAPASARMAGRGAGPRLVLLVPAGTGYEPGTEFPVAGVMTLGRDGDSGIVLGDVSVSGAHARLERVANGWRLVDLGSTNGTVVNGREVGARGVALRGGEQVAIGSVRLQFRN